VLADRDRLVEQGRQEAARLADEGELLLEQARREAERRVADGERALEQARVDAEQVLAEAEAERTRMVEADAIFQLARSQADELETQAHAEADALLTQAHAEADALLTQAHAEAEDMRRQTDDYVDAKLAQFEAVLASTLTAVARGRSRLGGPTAADLDGRDDR